MSVSNGLYKRGESWYICVKVNGSNIRKSFGKDKRAAELALAEVRKQRAVARASDDWSGLEKLTTPKSLTTFAEAAHQYLDERAHNKPSTLTTYGEHLKNHLLPEFGKLQIAKITEEHVARFQAKLATRLSPRRTNSTINLLRSILKVCVRRKMIEENPCDGVDRLREQQAEIDPLNLDELKLALSKTTDLYRPIFTCLAWTGARPGELLALRWRDVDFKRAEIRINKARVKGKESLPKTGSSERYIPMLPPVVEALKQLLGKIAHLDESAYVFTNKSGKPINSHMDSPWAVALRKAGLRHRPSYQLRHTFASICLQQGVNPGWIAKTLGHSNLQITFRHYARFIKDTTKENEKIMSNLFVQSVSENHRLVS